MPILVFSTNGKYTTKTTLEEARVALDCANKTVVVTTALTEAQSNIIGAWPTDRALKVEKDGSVNNSTAFTINGPFEAGLYQVFGGSGSVTGLKEAKPEWFGASLSASPSANQAAIQNAINALISGGMLLLPIGELIIQPLSDVSFSIIGKSITVRGCGIGQSVIKVVNSAGNYNCIFSSTLNTGGSVEFSDFTLDQNCIYNAGTSALLSGYPQFAISIDTTHASALISRIEILNAIGVNQIVVASTNSIITNCIFKNIGNDSYAHDLSCVYTRAEVVLVKDNIFLGSNYIGGESAVTALEVHGGQTNVSGNVFSGWQVGINLTGVDERVGDSRGQTVSGNVFHEVEIGIQLWSLQHLTHLTGYGLDGVNISGNTFRIKESGRSSRYSLAAILAYPLNDLPMRNIIIGANSVTYDLAIASTSVGQTYYKSGYVIVQNDTTIVNENISIEGGSIHGAYSAGIYISASFIGLNITNVKISDCWNNPVTTYNAGIYLRSPNMSNLRIVQNSIRDSRTTTKLQYGMQISSFVIGDPTFVNTVVQANTIDWNSLGLPPTLEYYIPYSAVYPLLECNVYDRNLVTSGVSMRGGSTIFDRSNRRIYRNFTGVTNWFSEVRGVSALAPTTGSWERGDISWRSTPIVGAGAGYVCVATGSPGTWASMPALI